MARIARQERLAALAGAATKVFGRLGYTRTRTAAVAVAAGMSAGSVFTYVESKEALFHVVFAHGFGLYDKALPPLPLATPARGETVALIEQNLRKFPAPRLRSALAEDKPWEVRSELAGIVEERYDMLADLWPLLAVIERSAADLPDLEAYYFRQARIGYFGQLGRYLETRTAAGFLRAMPDAAVTARLISESVAWFAWKRHEGRDALLYDDERARNTVVEFICSALLPATK